MFNKQLRKNIEAMDLQIGNLSEELHSLKRDTKYDVKIKTLTDLVEVRSKLTKNEDSSRNDTINELDKRIEEITMVLGQLEYDEEYSAKVKRLEELTSIRCQLADAKVKESNAPAIISGVIGVSAVLLVLHHEKTDIITSKAFSMATKMFRGN